MDLNLMTVMDWMKGLREATAGDDVLARFAVEDGEPSVRLSVVKYGPHPGRHHLVSRTWTLRALEGMTPLGREDALESFKTEAAERIASAGTEAPRC